MCLILFSKILLRYRLFKFLFETFGPFFVISHCCSDFFFFFFAFFGSMIEFGLFSSERVSAVELLIVLVCSHFPLRLWLVGMIISHIGHFGCFSSSFVLIVFSLSYTLT